MSDPNLISLGFLLTQQAIEKVEAEKPRPMTDDEIAAMRERKGSTWCPCMMYRFRHECDCPPDDEG